MSDLSYIENRLIPYYDLSDSDRRLIDDLVRRTIGHEDRDGTLLEAREEVERLRWQAERDALEIENLKSQLQKIPESELEAQLRALVEELQKPIEDDECSSS